MDGKQRQQQFMKEGLYGPVYAAAGTMGGYGETEKSGFNPNLYGPLNKAIGTQAPKAQYWNRGMGQTFPPNLYNSVNQAVGTQAPKAKYWNRGQAGYAGFDPKLYGPVDKAIGYGSFNPNLYGPIDKALTPRSFLGQATDAAAKTVPGIVVVAILAGIYFLFIKKNDAAKNEVEEEIETPAEGGASFYY